MKIRTEEERKAKKEGIRKAFGNEILAKVLDVLKCYDKCHLTMNWGEIKVSTMWGVTNGYAPDHWVSDEIFADDVYSPEERDENYKESFGYYRYPLYVEEARKQG